MRHLNYAHILKRQMMETVNYEQCTHFLNCTYQPEFHFDVFEFFNTADSFGDIISIKWFCNKTRKRYYLLKLIGKRQTKLTVSLAIRH